MLYRAYFMQNGHVWMAVDLTCSDDEDAKKQIESLLDRRDIELWPRDRRVAVLRARHHQQLRAYDARKTVMRGEEKRQSSRAGRSRVRWPITNDSPSPVALQVGLHG